MTMNNEAVKKPVSRATKIEVVCFVGAVCATAIWASLLFGSTGSEARAASSASARVTSLSTS